MGIKVLLAAALASLACGSVQAATLRASPTWVYFNDTKVGGPTQTQYVTITNTGPDTAENVSDRTSCNHHFSVLGGCFGNLSVGQSCNLTVQYHPRTQGSHVCSIYVSGANTNTEYIQVQGSARPRFTDESEENRAQNPVDE